MRRGMGEERERARGARPPLSVSYARGMAGGQGRGAHREVARRGSIEKSCPKKEKAATNVYLDSDRVVL